MNKGTFEYLYTTEEDGVEIHMGVNANGESFYFTLRELGCEAHEKVQRKYNAALSRVRNNSKKEHEILSKIIAESILVDWRGVIDNKGKEIPCTMENKLDALMKHKKLLYAVMTESSKEENFRHIDDDDNSDEDTEKNSSKS